MANPAFALANTTAVLASDVADAGTVIIPYPTGFVQADLTGTTGGMVVINDNDVWLQDEGDVSFTFGATDITITNSTGVTWPAGASLIASFGAVDITDSEAVTV